MAISQVRVQIRGQWYTLTYNEQTHMYEAQLSLTGTSYHEPGGYFNVTAEVSNDAGETVLLDGSQYPPLRLFLKETTPPVLTLISPSEGYIHSHTPEIVVEATDGPEGSGINPSTFHISADGGAFVGALVGHAVVGESILTENGQQIYNALVGEAVAGSTVVGAGGEIEFSVRTEQMQTGFRFICIPLSPLSEGPHRITVSVTDNDGNTARTEYIFIVDTVAPLLWAWETDLRLLLDVEQTEISGVVLEETSPPAEIAITVNGQDAGAARSEEDGRWSCIVPLDIGLNEIIVRATDQSGLFTDVSVTLIRLITDRAQSDLDTLRELLARGMDAWSAQELEEYLRLRSKGAYNSSDYQRVVLAMIYLRQHLQAQGYIAPSGIAAWTNGDSGKAGPTRNYLNSVQAFRPVLELPETAPVCPDKIQHLWEANNIEASLIAVDEALMMALRRPWYSGEILCGEV